MATVLAAFARHRQRLNELRPRVLVGEFGGAAGTLSSLGGRGLAAQAELMKELKLGTPAIAWHTVRDLATASHLDRIPAIMPKPSRIVP
jgi:3-carboxy-cis,cis-muconate cycloisomerase